MCHVHTRHTTLEKIYFRFTILGSYFTGAGAMFSDNKILGVLYVVLMIASLEHVLKHFCSHCPYPCEHSDCLMTSYKKPLRYIKPGQEKPTLYGRWSFPLVMLIGLPLIPQFWLIRHTSLLVIFWTLFALAWIPMLVFKCRHCQFDACLLNRTPRQDAG